MNYLRFKEQVKNRFLDFMPSEYAGSTVEVEKMRKLNREVDVLKLDINNGYMKGIGKPTIYINDLYEQYKQSGDLDSILKEASKIMLNGIEHIPHILDTKENALERMKTQITVALINTEQNKEMLENIPHREFNDLSVIYKWTLKADNGGMTSAIIKDVHLQRLGMNEEELYKMAMTNTERLYPVKVQSMEDIISEMLMEDFQAEGIEIEDNDVKDMVHSMSNGEMYVFTNSIKTNGASAMLFEDKLYEFAEKVGGNFYIIPSSIHEFIAVSAEVYKPDELAEMVYEVNQKELHVSERLSNEVYLYDMDERKIKLATDVQNKSLSDIVPMFIYESDIQSKPERSR